MNIDILAFLGIDWDSLLRLTSGKSTFSFFELSKCKGDGIILVKERFLFLPK